MHFGITHVQQLVDSFDNFLGLGVAPLQVKQLPVKVFYPFVALLTRPLQLCLPLLGMHQLVLQIKQLPVQVFYPFVALLTRLLQLGFAFASIMQLVLQYQYLGKLLESPPQNAKHLASRPRRESSRCIRGCATQLQ